MILIFMGLPGSGKGTQAQRFARVHGLTHISTGDLVRHEIATASQLGIEIKSIVEHGGYPSDHIILSLVKKILTPHKNIILDGFPRTLHQATEFDKLLEQDNLAISAVIKFGIDDNTVMQRLSGRFACAECGYIYNQQSNLLTVEGVCNICPSTKFVKRKDDLAESIEKRIKIYHDMTQPVEDYYQSMEKLISIDATRLPENVFAELNEILIQKTFVDNQH